jgi:hypothetical protein
VRTESLSDGCAVALASWHVVAASMVRSWCGIGLLAFVTALESMTRGKQIEFISNDLQHHWIFVLDFDVSVQPPGMLLLHPWCAAGVELASRHIIL